MLLNRSLVLHNLTKYSIVNILNTQYYLINLKSFFEPIRSFINLSSISGHTSQSEVACINQRVSKHKQLSWTKIYLVFIIKKNISFSAKGEMLIKD